LRYIEVTPETGPLTLDAGETLSDAYVRVRGPVAGISLVDPSEVTIKNVVVDCYEVPRKHDAHGVRVTGDVRGLDLDRVTVLGAAHYGFGFQRVQVTGTPIMLAKCVSVDSDADGFDFKVMSHIHGIAAHLIDCRATSCPVGFDVRGEVVLYDCSTYRVRTTVRFHGEPEGSPNGLSGSGEVIGFRYRGRKVRGPKKTRGAGEVVVDGWERVV